MIKVEGLSIRNGQNELLRVDTLEIPDGRFHVLMGRSGAGKSLLVNAVCGLSDAALSLSGCLRLDERSIDLSKKHKLWRNQIFLAPQNPLDAFNPTMSVARQLQEVLRWRPMSRALMNLSQLGEAVQLTSDQLERLPSQLSGGMVQRALLAMALAARAHLVVLDEPTKGLDPLRFERVASLLQLLRTHNRSALVVTHDPKLAARASEDMTVIEAGRVVETGQTKRLLHAPQSSALKSLMAAEPENWRFGRSPGKNNTQVLSLDGISHRYGSKGPLLLRDVSLQICRGEVCGLLGPSGAGKSTLGDIALGVLEPTAGRVFWGEKDIGGLPAAERNLSARRYLKVFQTPEVTYPHGVKIGRIFKSLTPMTAASGGVSINELLEQMGLNERVLDLTSRELSGGELQRLAIVRVLISDPEFVVCDEPSSRLDMTVQKQAILAIASAARRYNFGTLLICHNRAVLEAVSDTYLSLTEDGHLIRL